MAAMPYREKRRFRKHTSRLTGTPRPPVESTRLVPLGTVASLGLWSMPCSGGLELSVRVAGRYEIQVGPGFQPHVLARLVRTLEQLA
jgi:hypothetical protein